MYQGVEMNLLFRVGKSIKDCQEVGDQGHAHPNKDDPRYGAICFRAAKDVSLELIIHELAHIQDREKGNKQGGHGTTWWELYLPMLKGFFPEREKFWRKEGFP